MAGIDRRALIAAGGAAVVVARPAFAQASGPIVDTTAGKVRGASAGPIHVFRGVRYGATTAGRRFLPPLPAQPWTGVRDATAYAARAPQLELKVMPESVDSQTHEPMSEDCLFLNVWTPGVNDRGKRPVMVWLHGGGFANGSGANTRYDGANIAHREDVVVVTVNHRLNVFGYLHLGVLAGERYAASGTVGLQDLVLALRWVKANIGAFGGDPERVTLLGESGGGRKTSVLMAMPSAEGLFHRAIVESGATIRMSTPEEATRAAEAVMAQLAVARPDAAKLASLPVPALLKAMADAGQTEVRPVVDGHVLPTHPFDPFGPRVSANVPMIIGSNATETTFRSDTPLDPISEAELHRRVREFTGAHPSEADRLIRVYRKGRPGASPVELYQRISTDYWIGADTVLQAERKAALGRAPAYLYHFEKTTPVRGGRLHSPHMLEIPYVLYNLDKTADLAGTDPRDYALAERMSRCWAAFARVGDPNTTGLPHWPPYSAAQRPVMAFNDDSKVVLDPRRDERLAIQALKAGQS